MGGSIGISRFTGMNNIREKEAFFSDEATCSPRIVLNADCTSKGRLVKRDGSTKRISLTAPHSLWSCDIAMLCVSESKLYRIAQGQAVEICTITGPNPFLSYVEVNNLIYMSCQYWNKVFDPSDNSISDWGMAVPDQPLVSQGAGNLPAGTYRLCFTRFDNQEISGNSAIASIQIDADRGIDISNRAADMLVWITDPNGSKFYLAGQIDNVVGAPLTPEPLPSFWCSPPPFMDYITLAFGRVWGSVGNVLYYSEPFHPEWFRLQFNRFDFDRDITLIAQVPTGIFVGCENETFFLKGSDPSAMNQSLAGGGAVAGTLHYCNNVPELSDILSPGEKVYVSVPVWLSQEGIVIGNVSGRLFNLTHQKVKFKPGMRGASMHRMKNGEFQYLTSFKQGSPGSGFGITDSATAEVFRNGKVI